MIDWNAPLVTRDGRPAQLLPQDGWQRSTGDTRRRVATPNDSRARAIVDSTPITVWLHNEEGRCNTSGHDSPMDVFNA